MTSTKFQEKLINDIFSLKYRKSFLPKLVLWIIDSNYRDGKRLDHHIQDQIENPDPYVLGVAQSFSHMKDDDAIIAIQRYVRGSVRYLSEMQSKWKRPEYWQTAKQTLELRTGDCLSWDTKLLKPNLSKINIEDVQVGDEIIGKNGRRVKVLNKFDKGVLPTRTIILNNGSEIVATNDHKFITRDGHDILCKDLQVGTLLKDNEEIIPQVTDEKVDTDYWYLKGLFVADGWTDEYHTDIFISGKDEHPKEKQKEWVKQYCIKNGITYRWDKKSIVVHSKSLFEDFVKCGKHAINKHIDILPTKKENIKALLEGLKADAYIRQTDGAICFGTISTQLKDQLRILYRVLGKSVRTTLVQPTRTQFGKNPIWRIYVRKKPIKTKVVGIIDHEDEHVYDITVENHEIYLPMNDIVVHNCDDINGLIHILAVLSGISELKIWSAIGNVTLGGHYWVVYLSTETDKLYAIDSTYHVSLQSIKTREELNTNNYKEIWWIFNGEYSWKSV